MDIEHWSLPGPKGLVHDLHETAKIVGVSYKTLERMIDNGEFPQGKLVSGKPTWSGSDIAAWLHLRGRFVNRLDKLGQNQEKVGQTRTNSDKREPGIEPD